MQRRYNSAYFVLASVILLGLMPLIASGNAHAQIAFVSSENGNADIYVMDADGGNPQNLTKNPNDYRYLSWSSDGKRITFTFNGDDNWEIYVMDADGGNPQQLTNSPLTQEIDPAWYSPAFAVAPTGKQFAMWGWLKQVAR